MVPSSANSRRRVFGLLVLFRWLSLVPPLAAVYFAITRHESLSLIIGALLVAVLINLAITRFASTLNNALIEHPWVLAFDLFFVALLFALTGGWHSPYYLYLLSPILAAAFFFGVPGGLLAAAAFLPLYLGAITLDLALFGGPSPDWLVIVLFVSGSFLLAITVGYVSTLLTELQSTQDTLTRKHQELTVLHNLSSSLQLSPSIDDVENQALLAITRDLGFKKAAVGLINHEAKIIDRWQASDQNNTGDHRSAELASWYWPADDSLIWQAIDAKTERSFNLSAANEALSPTSATADPINHLHMKGGLILPLLWGVRAVGVLLVDLQGQDEQEVDLTVLSAIARQTAVSLGMMMTRLRHAKENAVAEERTRIALDLHDTISQSLMGLVYTLQGCLKLLPDNPEALQDELEWALAAAEDVRKKIRATIHDIWPVELSAQQFENDLRSYAADVLQAADLDITFDIRGQFNTLSPPVRRGMYRICQESLTNIIHHASARESRICVDVADGRARIILRDNGRGFEPDIALAQDFSGDHFGLRGMRERAASLGGTCEIYSQPGEGTSILIDIPANVQAHHE